MKFNYTNDRARVEMWLYVFWFEFQISQTSACTIRLPCIQSFVLAYSYDIKYPTSNDLVHKYGSLESQTIITLLLDLLWHSLIFQRPLCNTPSMWQSSDVRHYILIRLRLFPSLLFELHVLNIVSKLSSLKQLNSLIPFNISGRVRGLIIITNLQS